jgi:hypothetical protein
MESDAETRRTPKAGAKHLARSAFGVRGVLAPLSRFVIGVLADGADPGCSTGVIHLDRRNACKRST